MRPRSPAATTTNQRPIATIALVTFALIAALFGPIGSTDADAAGPYSPQNLRQTGANQQAFAVEWDAPTSPVDYYRLYVDDNYRSDTSFLGEYFDNYGPDQTHTVGVQGVAADGTRSEIVTVEVTTTASDNTGVYLPYAEIEVTEGNARGFSVEVLNDVAFQRYYKPGGFSIATDAGTATPGEDFYGAYKTVTDFGGYDEYYSFYLDILDDDIVEPDETFDVRLFAPTNDAYVVDNGTYAFKTVRVTIVDDDEPADLDPVWVYLHTSLVGEGWRTPVLELRATHSASAPLPTNGFTIELSTVAGSAEPGSDYYGQYTVVTFPPGVDRVEVPLTVLDDNIAEAEESFSIRLFNANNDRIKVGRVGPVRIRDND